MSADFELLAAWRAGDRDAGGELIERHVPALYRFFCNKVSSEVDDLTQRTLLACVRSRDSIRDESSFRAYLFAIARNELKGYYRQQDRRPTDLDRVGASVADMGTTPTAAIARSQDHARLLQALRELPLDLQILLELHYWEHLTGPELARALDVPEGTVRTRLRKGRQMLHEALIRAHPDLTSSTTDDLERWVRRVRDAFEADRAG